MVKYSNAKIALIMALFVNVGLILLSLSVVVEGQSICNMTEAGLMACRPSVTPPNPTKPTPECCSALSHADLACLCRYKNSTILPSFGVDPKLATKLPLKCKLPHPAPC